MRKKPRISFGIIVLNGMPFVKYCLRQIYPFAYEIIVVEGANPNAKTIANKKGHSTDGTIKALKEFKKHEDKEGKLTIITKDGFWKEKDDQSQAYTKKIKGDYLWQIDIDEFYRAEDIRKVIQLLTDRPEITQISFKQISFWGGIDYFTDGWYFKRKFPVVQRVFKWGNGFCYITHRPPTVVDQKGTNLKKIKYLDGRKLYKKHKIILHHYCLLFPRQVKEKSIYCQFRFKRDFLGWLENNFFRLNDPFRVHNEFDDPSWFCRFKGRHPRQIYQMMKDIKSGKVKTKLRENQDIEALLASPGYKVKVFLFSQPYYYWHLVYNFINRLIKNTARNLKLLKNLLEKKYPNIELRVYKK